MKKEPAESATTTSGSTTEADSCTDAISKIESALELSSNFMKASGDKPTLKDIQAVLITLQSSLGSECGEGEDDEDDNDNGRKVKRDGPLGNLSDEDQAGGLIGTVLGSGGDDDEEDDEEESDLEDYMKYCRCINTDEDAVTMCLKECAKKEMMESDDSGSKMLVTREAGCSECERQLYHIVQQLQDIFTIGSDLPEADGGAGAPSKDGPGGRNVAQVEGSKAVTPAINATVLAPAQLRRRAVQLVRH